jgi:hypothetical protein
VRFDERLSGKGTVDDNLPNAMIRGEVVKSNSVQFYTFCKYFRPFQLRFDRWDKAFLGRD